MNSVNILNDEKLLRTRNQYFSKMEKLFAGEKPEKPFYLLGREAYPKGDGYANPEQWMREALDSVASAAEVLLDETRFRPLCVEFQPYGVHFMGKLLGADVFYDAATKQWYSHFLTNEIGTLKFPDLDKSAVWKLARSIAYAFLEAKVQVPIFALPGLSSVLNVAINLYGERLLLAMYDEPEKVHADLKTISSLIITLHQWYLKTIPLQQLQMGASASRTQPPGHGQFCGCSTQLVSAEAYAEFFAPLDQELLSTYPHGGMIHLCGSHTQHIPVFKTMKSLKCVQLNDRAADDFYTYYDNLRDDQILYFTGTPNISFQQSEEYSHGRRVVFVKWENL